MDPLRRLNARLGLTKRALGLFIAGTVLASIGRVLALQEMFTLAVACWVSIVLGLLIVHLAPARLAAERRTVPPRTHAGQPCRVDLRLANTGERTSPIVTVRDPFDGGRRHARFRVAPMPCGGANTAGYRIPTEQRGVFSVGPLVVERCDPLGVARHRTELAGVDEITVYPRIASIAPPARTKGRDPRGGTVARPALGPSSDEFYALRPYVVGDDLRRVHWASSARFDELMIRQDELPWDGRATVVVDASSAAHTDASFETAMSVAASIVIAADRGGLEVRLLLAGCTPVAVRGRRGGGRSSGGSSSVDTGHASGHAHVERCLELLAAAAPSAAGGADLGTAIAGLARAGLRDESLYVVATPRSIASHLTAAGRLGGRSGSVTVLLLEEAPLDAGTPGPRGGGAGIMRINSFSSFASTWNAAVVGRPVRSHTSATAATTAAGPPR